MTTLNVEHEGITICFDEGADYWKAVIDGNDLNDRSLAELKKKISKVLKPKISERQPAFKMGGRYGYGNEGVQRVMITSVIPSRYGSPEAWVIDTDKSRSKLNLSYLYAVNETTEKLAIERTALTKEVARINKLLETNKSKFDMHKIAYKSKEAK